MYPIQQQQFKDTQIAKPSDELQSRGMQGGDQSLLKQYLSQLGPQTQPPAPGSQSTSTFHPIEPEGWPYNMGDRSQPLRPPPTIIPGSLGGYGNDTPAIPAQTGNPMTQQLGFPGGQNNSTQSGMGGSSTQVGGSSGGGGKQSLSIGQVGLTFDPSGGGATQSFADGGIASLGRGIASFGRNNDTQLVHMTPGEVQGLQQLALSHGGSLTVNPHTGLVEAGFLSSLLSIGGGIVGGMFGPMGAAAGSSLGSLVGGDDPKTALMRGALSGGLSGLMGGVEAEGLGALNTTDAQALMPPEEFATNMATNQGPYDMGLGTETVAAPNGSGYVNQELPPQTPEQIADLTKQAMPSANQNFGQQVSDIYAKNDSRPYTDKLGAGFNQVTSSGKNAMDFLKNNKLSLAAAGIGLAGMIPPPAPPVGLQDKTGYSPQYTYDPKTQRYIAAAPMSYTYKGAEGGEVPGFKDGVYIPQSKNIRTNIYGSNAGPIGPSGKQMFKNDDKYAGLEAQIGKLSPSMLSKISQDGTDSIAQGIAITELYDRANNPNPAYVTKPTMQAAQGGIMRFGIGGSTSATVTAQDAPQYQYNPADQTYAQQAAAAPQGSGNMFIDMAPQLLRALTGQTSAPTAKQYSYDRDGQKYTQNMAAGGIASLPNEYAAGGKLLQGPGDGMSDSIPAVIKGDRPQRAALAQGEFVIPADVVSHLGNGSTDAGAKRLYAMMDKIRHARTGTKKQGRQINPANFMPA